MYAVIATGGKQYRVTEGALIQVETVEGEPGQQVEFEDVLFVGNEAGSQDDLPALDKVKVVGTILEQGRGDRIIVFKFKRRKMYRRKQGHRQYLTFLQIDQVSAGGKKSSEKSAALKPVDDAPQTTETTEKPEAEAGEE